VSSSQTRPRLLVTGASGFLGWNLCPIAARTWEVFGVMRSHVIEIPGVTPVTADLTDISRVKQLFAEVRPNALVHLAALSQPNDCQKQPGLSRRMNVEAPSLLAGLCADAGIPMVFTSTDLVFDGEHAPYREDSQCAPVCLYGEHKVEAERAVLSQCERACVCRMPLMYGDPGPAAANFAWQMISAMREGRQVKLFADEYRTPAGGSAAAEGLLLMLSRNQRGIVHLGGRERVSRAEFGRIAARVMGVQADIVEVRRSDVPMSAPRPADVSMDSSRAFALGYEPGTVEDQLRGLALRSS